MASREPGRVIGIGGLFFKSADPSATRAWYARILGIEFADWGGTVFLPQDAAAYPGSATVFSPFGADTDYFAADRPWMLNLRVDDLDGLCAALRASGIAVTTNPEWNMPGVGRFARLHDPEGNPIELWEPDPAG